MTNFNEKDSIVISGISGRFPECLSIAEFRDKILAGQCLVTHDEQRWPNGLYDLPTGHGKVPKIEDFDAQFFGYTDIEADLLDPLSRLMITESYSAIMDAGLDPKVLRGSNTGFFFGSFIDEVQSVFKNELDRKENIFQYHASRVHQALDLRGPTCYLENACSTSLSALSVAFDSLKCGLCDRALVGGVNIIHDPTKIEMQAVFNMLSSDSTCHVFDEKAHGYVRSETAVVIFLQKKTEAKRIYAQILSTNINADGYKDEGFVHPGWKTQRDLMLAAMKEAGVSGKDFNYFEAHGTGTQAGDKTELRSIQEAICRDRNEPLVIGSIKSIVGHALGGSGLASLAKIIIAYQCQRMAPNLFFEKPNPLIPALTDGTYSVNTKAHHFSGGVSGINNFGLGGGNSTVILNSYDVKHTSPDFEDNLEICHPLPRLILMFGRNNHYLNESLDELEKSLSKITRGFCSLLNDLSGMDPRQGWASRGYLLLDDQKEVFDRESRRVLSEENDQSSLWLVFSGLGSQWQGMARDFMSITIFANSVHDSIKILTSLGYDDKLLRNYLFDSSQEDTKIDENQEPIICAIVICELAFFDTLATLGIQPSKIVGHSIGEIGAAYADQCITKKESLLLAYTIERELIQVRNQTPGMMLAVALSWQEASSMCFESIDVVCSNSPTMVTMAGRLQEMEVLKQNLKAKGIGVVHVKTNGIMAHGKFLKSSFGALFGKAMRKLRINPKQRSSRFLSTSFAEKDWSSSECQTPDSEYFINNILNPVYFDQVIRKAPKETLFIEIGPTEQLKSLIFQTHVDNKSSIQYKGLARRHHQTNLMNFFKAMGTLYINGQNLNLNLIYSQIQYPLSRHTEFLSPIFRYDHSKPRLVPKFPEYFNFKTGQKDRDVFQETVLLSNSNHRFIEDHSVDGIILYPATGYLCLVWKTIARYHKEADFMKFPVEMRKIKLSRATKLTKDKPVHLKCHYFPDSGSFSIIVNQNVCVSGYVFPLKKNYQFIENFSLENNKNESLVLDGETFYRELRVRGYQFGPNFQNIVQVHDNGCASIVRWTEGNMITFLDSILQIALLGESMRFLSVPTLIETFRIDPVRMEEKLYFNRVFKTKVLDVKFNKSMRLISAEGVEVLNAQVTSIARRLDFGDAELVIESQQMIPYNESNAIDSDTRQVIQDYLSNCEMPLKNETDLNNQRNCGLFSLLKFDRLEPENLDNDVLHSTITSDRFLRTQLDVVMENINLYAKLNVLEINTSQQMIYPALVKIIGRSVFGFSMTNLIYTIAHSLPEKAETKLAAECQFNRLVKFIPYDVSGSCVPYLQLKQVKQELIIYRDPRLSLHQIDMKTDHNLLLRSIETTLADSGFFLAFLRCDVHSLEAKASKDEQIKKFRLNEVDEFIEQAKEAGLAYVCKKFDTFTCCSLMFRKTVPMNHDTETIIEIDKTNLDWVEKLKQANRDDQVSTIWLYTTDPLCGIVGMVKALAKDVNKNKAKYMFFDQKHLTLAEALKIGRTTQLLQNAFIETQNGSFRHLTFPSNLEFVENVENFEYRQLKTGDISSFRPFFRKPVDLNIEKESQSFNHFGPREDNQTRLAQVDIHRSSFNFRDMMVATGRMTPADSCDTMTWDDLVLGMDFAGTIHKKPEQRVMGYTHRTLATSAEVFQEYLWPVPANWTLTQASTVTVVYATCYYALMIRGKLQPKESILIHSGTSGIGLAAINICLAMNCRIFTTASTEYRREWLKKNYPQIESIGNSGDTSFLPLVLKQTEGRGVDLVLNSLIGEQFWASLKCLGENGRFLEIGKYMFMGDDPMSIEYLLQNKSFFGVHLDRLHPDRVQGPRLTRRAIRERKKIWHLMDQGIKSGVVKPLPYTVFNHTQIESAFRFMSSEKRIGKVVIEFHQNETIKTPLSVRAIPRTYFHPEKSYIIAGGLGGMGLELMFWMQERGARKFVLTSRSGVTTPTQKWMIKRVRQNGCTVEVSTEDGGTSIGASKIIATSERLGMIGGIFLSTLVIANEHIDRLTVELFHKTMYPKSTQALVFDEMLRKLPYSLDYFVGFSSMTAGRGIPGQTNYAFANSILERVCEQRVRDGLAGVAVQWGLIGDVGYVAENLDVKESLRGFRTQPIVSCWQYLDRFIQSSRSTPVCGSFVRVEQKIETIEATKISLLENVCNIMGIKNLAKLNPSSTLANLGLDSMMAAEIGSIFENEFRMALTPKDIRSLTIEKISKISQ